MKKFTPESYAAEVIRNIRAYGFHLTYVPAEEEPSFCYSTGLFETAGIPELFISSLPPALSGELAHSYARRFKASPPPVGKRIKKDKTDPFDYYLINVNLADVREYVLASIKYYGERPFSYLQLVFPDTDMLFPHEQGYDYDQEILGDYSGIGYLKR